MSDTTDERIAKIELAATQWNSAWIARPALEVIRELQERERAKDEALREALSCLESPRASVVAKINAALAQQPADQPDEWECCMCSETMASEATWADCGHEHCPMLPSEMEAGSADQPAQGERLDPHTLERAADVMVNLAGSVDEDDGPYFEGYRAACGDGEVDLRNLRDGGDT